MKRTAAGFELSGGIGLEVGARIEDPLFGCYVEAFAKGSLGFTAKGDSGAECFQLVGLGIHEYLSDQATVACVPEEIATKWPDPKDQQKVMAVIKNMSVTRMAGREGGWVFSASAEGTISGKKVKGDVGFFKTPDSDCEVELKVEMPVSAGSIAASAAVLWETWSGVATICIGHGQNRLGKAELKQLEGALLQDPRGAAMGQLMKSGFFHPAVEFEAKYAGGKVQLAIDLVNSKSFEKKADAGIGEAKVEGEIKTSTSIFDQSFPLPLGGVADKAKSLGAK